MKDWRWDKGQEKVEVESVMDGVWSMPPAFIMQILLLVSPPFTSYLF